MTNYSTHIFEGLISTDTISFTITSFKLRQVLLCHQITELRECVTYYSGVL